MDANQPDQKGNLPRLDREAYRGLAVVHWVFNIEGRKKGWLDEHFFLRFQLVALHAFSRYRILSPCITAMPDHIHLLLMGYSDSSDQKLAVPFLRKNLKSVLGPEYVLQKTPYDHVLRKEERNQNQFVNMASYVRRNPFRAGLVAEETDSWPCECCLIPGYPELEMRQEDFWERFWKIYHYLLEKNAE